MMDIRNKLFSKKTAILFLSLLFIVMLFIRMFFIQNTEDYIKEKFGIFSEFSWNRPLAVYLVKSVSSCCRNFPRLDELIANDTQFIIFVDSDFSNPDINNLRIEFGFPYDSTINRIGPIMDNINVKLNKKSRQQNLNWFILFSYNGELEDWRYF